MKKIGLIIGIGLILGGGIFLFTRGDASDAHQEMSPLRVQIETLSSGPLAYEKTYIGQVKAQEETVLSAQVFGLVEKIYKKEGEVMRKGEVLVALDASVAQANQDLAGEGIDTAEDSLEDTEEYYDQRVDEAEAHLEKAEDAYDQAKESGDDDAREIAKNDRDIAKEAVKSAKDMRDMQIQNAENTLDIAQKQYAVAREQKELSLLRAPYTGIVVYEHLSVGDMVSPGVPILSVAKSYEKEVKVSVSEELAQKLSLDQSVELRKDNMEFSGAITSISASGEARKSRVSIALSSQTSVQRNAYIEVDFVVLHAGSGISIPLSAVVSEYYDTFVYVERSGVALKQKVTLGEVFGERVEVRDGLEQGDRIIIHGQHALRNNQVVATYE